MSRCVPLLGKEGLGEVDPSDYQPHLTSPFQGEELIMTKRKEPRTVRQLWRVSRAQDSIRQWANQKVQNLKSSKFSWTSERTPDRDRSRGCQPSGS
mgnify:CR=1 FL=1